MASSTHNTIFLIIPVVAYIVVLGAGFDLDTLRRDGRLFEVARSEEKCLPYTYFDQIFVLGIDLVKRHSGTRVTARADQIHYPPFIFVFGRTLQLDIYSRKLRGCQLFADSHLHHHSKPESERTNPFFVFIFSFSAVRSSVQVHFAHAREEQ